MSSYKGFFPDQSGNFMEQLLKDGTSAPETPTCKNCEHLERELAFVTDAWKRSVKMLNELARSFGAPLSDERE